MQIGAGEYRLCGLDTNIYSELLKEPTRYVPALTKLLGGAPTLLCFSPYTLYELRACPDVFAKFVDMFDVFPCAILKNEEQLIAEEADAYERRAPVDPLLFGFSYFNRPRGTNLRKLLAEVFATPEVAQREKAWPTLKKELLRDWVALKQNYPPKGRGYTLVEAKDFARRVAIQQIAEREPEFYQRLTGRGETLDVNRFPSLMISLLGVFFRIYEPVGRKPTTNDVFDVLISAPTPYLDVVISEKMQGEIVRKARRFMPSLMRIDVHALRDVRNFAPQPPTKCCS